MSFKSVLDSISFIFSWLPPSFMLPALGLFILSLGVLALRLFVKAWNVVH